MDLNDLQNLIPGAIKDVGTGIATATGAVKAWNALQQWNKERSQGLALSIRSAFYTRDYLGIALVGEVRNTTANTVQLTDWILEMELPGQRLALSGGPPRGGGLYPGAPVVASASNTNRGQEAHGWRNVLLCSPGMEQRSS
jgi:hypothetical protein